MPYQAIEPEEKQCPQCGTTFEVGGRGRRRRDQIYCSRRCHMLARPPLANPGSHAPRPKKYKDTLHDEAWLRARYETDGLSLAQISVLIGAPKPTVRWALHKWNIPVRSAIVGKALLFEHRVRKVVTQEEFIAAYGGKCACCGETERAFLTVDHIGGGGAEHRRQFGGQNKKVLQDIKRQGWPKDKYRCLCMNCNHATRYGRVCPHIAASITNN